MTKLAGIQFACSIEKERNLEKAVQLGTIAAERGANVICFQELFNTHWFPKEMNPASFSLAEGIDGASIRTMQELAKQKDVVLICPFFERDGQGAFFNSAVVIDAGGKILGAYRKVHVPQIPLWEEKFYFTPGNLGFPVFWTKFGAIGVQICWDNFFPEGARILALKGAQVIFAPTAAAFASMKRWQIVISGNAISNGVFVFRVNRVGSEEKQDFYGHSFCVSPEGELLDKPTGLSEGIALIDVDLGEIEKVRKEWAFLKDRRPELYQEIIAERGR